MLSRWSNSLHSIATRRPTSGFAAVARLVTSRRSTTAATAPVAQVKHEGPESARRLKGAMIQHLAHSRPHAALRAFVDHLDRPAKSHSGRTLEGLVWVLVAYREPRLALEAVAEMDRRGYAVSSRLAAKLLRSFGTEIMFDSDRLVRVLKWIKAGIETDKREGKLVDEHMVETVVDVLKKMGRTDWSAQVFDAYRESLGSQQLGHARVWAAAISAAAAGGDVHKAQLLFKDWRTAYSGRGPPPEAPYLALLNHFAVNCPPLPASKDPAYLLLQLVKADGLVPSTPFLNALLRVELSRKRFSSFWGIWTLFDELDLTRDPSTWKLATRAKLVSDEQRRQRGRFHRSPLLHLAPVEYIERRTPTARTLFSHLVSTRLELTSNRPSLRVPTSKRDPFAAAASASSSPVASASSSSDGARASSSSSSSLLDHFLSLFVSRQDFSAAVVALETFHVHRISPTSKTHSTVVLSVVRLWERGRFDDHGSPPWSSSSAAGSNDDSTTATTIGFGHGTLGIEGRESQARSRARDNLGRGGGGGGGREAVEAIRKILERRRVRVGLWQQQRDDDDREDVRWRQRRTRRSSSSGLQEEEEDDADEDDDDDNNEEGSDLGARGSTAGPPPKWMVQREMRDTRYLVELLEKCSGLDADAWRREVELARRDLLPPRKGEDEGRGVVQAKQSKRNITRGARFRKERFGKEL